jgi:hypothetical protein
MAPLSGNLARKAGIQSGICLKFKPTCAILNHYFSIIYAVNGAMDRSSFLGDWRVLREMPQTHAKLGSPGMPWDMWGGGRPESFGRL